MSARGRQRPPKAEARHGRTVPAAMVLLFMLTAQMGAAVHFLLIPHALDQHSGKTVRLRPPHEHQESSGDAGRRSGDRHRPERSSSDDECPVCAVLHQSKIPVAAVSTAIPDALLSVEPTAPFPKTPTEIRHRRVYLVSPSHSPPGA